MQYKYKIWIEKDDNTVFGMGISRLLTLVEETGSLHKAAMDLKMSYRAAWGKIRDYEKRLGVGLLEKGRHGRTGAHLTAEGKEMLLEFNSLTKELDQTLDKGPAQDILSKIEKIGRKD